MKTVVLVPYRSDRGHRDLLWEFVRERFWGQLPYDLAIGTHYDGPFNRSAAINKAAETAGSWDVALVADADTWAPPGQVAQAVELAATTGRLASALTVVAELSRYCTDLILDTGQLDPLALEIDHLRTDDLATQSSIIAVPRPLWDALGGFDDRFVGWGGEDNAFWRACELTAGRVKRVNGCAFHLWHEPAADRETRMRDRGYRANLAHWQRYQRARSRQDLRRLLDGR